MHRFLDVAQSKFCFNIYSFTFSIRLRWSQHALVNVCCCWFLHFQGLYLYFTMLCRVSWYWVKPWKQQHDQLVKPSNIFGIIKLHKAFVYGFFNCSELKLQYEIGADYINESAPSRLHWVQTHYLPKMESTCLPGMPGGTFSKSIRFISHIHLLKTHKKCL